MRKTYIHIGGAYRRNPEREVRLSGFAPGIPSGMGGTEVSGFGPEQGSEAARALQFLAMSFEHLMGDSEEVERLRKDPRAREALANLTRVFQGMNERLAQSEHHSGLHATMNVSGGQAYVRSVAKNAGMEAARRGHHMPVGVGSYEARAGQGLMGANAVHVQAEHIPASLEGMSEEEMFATVEKVYRIKEDKEAEVREMRARREQEWICAQRPLCPRGYTLSYAGRQRIVRARADFMKAIYPKIKETGIMGARADYMRLSRDFHRRVGVRFVDYRGAKESLAEKSRVVIEFNGQVVGSIDPETGEGAYPRKLKAQMLEWATLPGSTRGNVKYVTVYPGDEFMEKHPTSEQQADSFRNERRESSSTVTARGRRALQNTTWAREYSPSAVNARSTNPVEHLKNVYEAYFRTNPAYYARYRSIMEQVEGRPHRVAWAQGRLHALYQEWEQARSQGKINIPHTPTLPQQYAMGSGGGGLPPFSAPSAYDASRGSAGARGRGRGLDRSGLSASTRGYLDYMGPEYEQSVAKANARSLERSQRRFAAGEFADLKDDPRYKDIMSVLEGRENDPYYWLWAQSQFRAMRQEKEQMKRNEGIDGEAIETREFRVHGEVGNAGVTIIVPKEYRLEGEDGIILVKDPRAWGEGPFWHSLGETYALERGIRVSKILHANGSTRGVRVEFTKPGIYEANGHSVPVFRRPDEGWTHEDVRVIREAGTEIAAIEAAMDRKKFKGYQLDFGKQKPRDLRIKKDDGELFVVNPNPPEGENHLYVREGIKIVRIPGPNYVFQIIFTQPGYYELQGYYRDGKHAFEPRAKITVPEFPNQSQA